MSKFTVKTKLSNIKKEDGEFTYNEEIVSMKWEEKAKRNAVQSGKGPGEFGPDYSHRKRYQLGEVPLRKQYEPHPIEPYVVPKKDHEGYNYTTDKDRENLEKYCNPVYQEKKGKYE